MSPIKAVIAAGSHLFPSRTEKLSPLAPMVLHTRGRVGSRHFSEALAEQSAGAFFVKGRAVYSPAGELCSCCGYNDRSNFHKHFLKVAGRTLAEYRDTVE